MDKPFPVGPFESGLVTTYSPWAIAMDAFQEMVNIHIHNGRLEQRGGLWSVGFGAHKPTTFSPTGDDIASFSGANPTVVTTSAAHNMSSSDQVVIIGGDETIVKNNRYTITVTGATTFTIPVDGSTLSYTSGAKVYLSPNNAVMGISSFVNSTNQEVMIGWDTRQGFIWDTSVDGFVPLIDSTTAPTNYMSCGTKDYIRFSQWDTATAGNLMYFTNGLTLSSGVNGIFTCDPTASPQVVSITPSISSTDEVYGCKGIEVFKNRLLLFSTREGASEGAAISFKQRVRWCRINDPRVSGEQWYDTTRGNGGFADASTQDQYIGHVRLLDEIVVYFTNSIWSLRYQPDPIEPFRWLRVNSHYSTRAPFANVGYDRHCISIGNRGIIITDRNDTKRADPQIQDFVRENINASEIGLIYGGRDYEQERSVFLYPYGTSTTNNRALVRDDATGAYSEWEIDLSVIGSGTTPPNSDLTMEDFPDSAEDNPYELPLRGEDAGELTWDSFFFQTGDEAFAGGGYSNQIYLLNFGNDDDGSTIQAELTTGEINPFREEGIEAKLVFVDFFFEATTNTNIEVAFYKDSGNEAHTRKSINLLPNLNEVANIDDIDFLSPSTSGITVHASSHGLSSGDSVYIYNVEGMTDLNRTQWTISNPLEDSFEIAVDASSFGTYTSGGLITKNEFTEQLVYKRISVGATGNSHRMTIFNSGTNDPLTIHRIIYRFIPVGGRQL